MNRKKKAIVSTMKSDSHTWNLVFLQMWLEERNFEVNNLGNCVSEAEIIKACETLKPDLLVISSVNGHGYIEAVDLIKSLQNFIDRIPIVIGGKLATSKKKQSEIKSELFRLGFNGVFIGVDSLSEFENYLSESNLLIGESEFDKENCKLKNIRFIDPAEKIKSNKENFTFA